MAPRRRTIGRLAREVGVGVETIRYYERRGLLQQPRRPADGGFREYGEEAVRLLRYVRLAQALGLTLADIEGLLARTGDRQATFCKAVRETVEAKLAAVRAELAALQKLEGELDGFLATCASRSEALPCPILAGLGALGARREAGAAPARR